MRGRWSYFEVESFCVLPTADVTLVYLPVFVGVQLNVFGQVPVLREASSADVADERFVFGMNSHMIKQVPSFLEYLVALLIFALEHPPFPVGGLVLLEIDFELVVGDVNPIVYLKEVFQGFDFLFFWFVFARSEDVTVDDATLPCTWHRFQGLQLDWLFWNFWSAWRLKFNFLYRNRVCKRIFVQER